MMSNGINVVLCPKARCESCEFSTNNYVCEQLMSIPNSKSRTLILEPHRGMIHLAINQQSQTQMPPWRGGRWQSVFVGRRVNAFVEDEKIHDAYQVGEYIIIIARDRRGGMKYLPFPMVRTALERKLLDQIFNARETIIIESNERKFSFEERIQRRKERVDQYLSEYLPEVSTNSRERLSSLVAHKYSLFGKLIPLFLDGYIEEIYLDMPRTPIYLDHRHLGRCQCEFSFDLREIQKLITLLRLESNLHLDRRNPSLKIDFHFSNAHLRISATIPPLSADGFSMEIRRAASMPFTIIDLISNGTVTLESAAVLLLAVLLRLNITITGEPGSGKTTLLNALDMTTPANWRKVYIEDAIESRKTTGHHQVRIRVDPFDERVKAHRKTDEIIKSLHRSPDYLILGEIQSKNHVIALFQAIMAGLHTIQTCHSRSAAELLSRWRYSLDGNTEDIALMDVIVTMYRPTPGTSRRRVKEIVEIKRETIEGVIKFTGLSTIYSIFDAENGESHWSNTGAFMNRAKESGIDDIETIFERLRDGLKIKLRDNQEGATNFDLARFVPTCVNHEANV